MITLIDAPPARSIHPDPMKRRVRQALAAEIRHCAANFRTIAQPTVDAQIYAECLLKGEASGAVAMAEKLDCIPHGFELKKFIRNGFQK